MPCASTLRRTVFALSIALTFAAPALLCAQLADRPGPTASADPLAPIRAREHFKLLSDLAAAYNPGLIPPTTSASILNYYKPEEACCAAVLR